MWALAPTAVTHGESAGDLTVAGPGPSFPAETATATPAANAPSMDSAGAFCQGERDAPPMEYTAHGHQLRRLRRQRAQLDAVRSIVVPPGDQHCSPWATIPTLTMLGALAAGILVVVAAGNAGPSAATIGYPADAQWVTMVAATVDASALGANTVDCASYSPGTSMGTTLLSTALPAPSLKFVLLPQHLTPATVAAQL